MKAFNIKIQPYEYWPFWLFYAPILPLWLWYALRSKSTTYFCKVNPGIEFGGFLDYSKHRILEQISPEVQPKTWYVHQKSEVHQLPDFPFVVKPDVGERGVNVEVIRSKEEWEKYSLTTQLILQEFVPYPLEFGVFYVRKPDAHQGEILSITAKEFLVFPADGRQTLQEFVQHHPRAKNREDYLRNKFKDQWEVVLPKGEQLILEPIGNHNRGTRFYDATALNNAQLNQKIDEIAQQIKGFFYGRFDVKAASIEAFQKGEFMVIEVNGANSEPTHIYDDQFTLFQAYKEVARHLKYQFEIAQFHPKTHRSIHFYRAILRRLVSN